MAVACALTVGVPTPVAEFRFHPTRQWRFDFAWPSALVALEVEGAVWTSGRHTRGSGFLDDMEKYNAAAALGWRVIRCAPGARYGLSLLDGFDCVKRALEAAR